MTAGLLKKIGGDRDKQARMSQSTFGFPTDSASAASSGWLKTAHYRAERSAVVVLAAGDVEMGSAPQLRRAIRDAIAEPATPPRLVVVDLSAVEYLASSGLQVLTHAAAEAHSHGTQLRVVAHRPMVRRAIEVAGLFDIVPVYWNRVAALED